MSHCRSPAAGAVAESVVAEAEAAEAFAPVAAVPAVELAAEVEPAFVESGLVADVVGLGVVLAAGVPVDAAVQGCQPPGSPAVAAAVEEGQHIDGGS